MATIHLQGKITEQGQLEVELPAGLPVGEARVTIEVPAADWTPQELKEALKIEPLTGAEMVAAGLVGGWEVDESGAEWVERQRRERRERRPMAERVGHLRGQLDLESGQVESGKADSWRQEIKERNWRR